MSSTWRAIWRFLVAVIVVSRAIEPLATADDQRTVSFTKDVRGQLAASVMKTTACPNARVVQSGEEKSCGGLAVVGIGTLAEDARRTAGRLGVIFSDAGPSPPCPGMVPVGPGVFSMVQTETETRS